MQSFLSFPLGSRIPLPRSVGIVLLLASSILSSFAGNTVTAPVVIVHPTNIVAVAGDTVEFSVVAVGQQPLSYQWFFASVTNKSGALLAKQTNSNLVLTNLTLGQAGYYYALVTNSVGRTNSHLGNLVMHSNPSRRVETGRVLQSGSQAGVPIIFHGTGHENALSFSLTYDPATFSNPVFLPANGSSSVAVNTTQAGVVGLSVALPAGEAFPKGYPWVGLFQFDLAPGAGPLDGKLAFTTNPVMIATTDTNGLSLPLSASVQPQYVLVNSDPELRAQTGLFEQQLVLGNPGAFTMTNIDILSAGLGVDSRTNLITVYNSAASLATLPFGEQFLDVPCDCACGFHLDQPSACDLNTYLGCGAGNCSPFARSSDLRFVQINNLAPGESRTVTMEFYVTDHFTVPHPQYSLFLADPLLNVLPGITTSLSLAVTRYTNGLFLVEFPTALGKRYYIQYAATPADLATNALTASPFVSGTGSRVQWLDNGPPKTVSPPSEGSRFYRVLQSQ